MERVRGVFWAGQPRQRRRGAASAPHGAARRARCGAAVPPERLPARAHLHRLHVRVPRLLQRLARDLCAPGPRSAHSKPVDAGAEHREGACARRGPRQRSGGRHAAQQAARSAGEAAPRPAPVRLDGARAPRGSAGGAGSRRRAAGPALEGLLIARPGSPWRRGAVQRPDAPEVEGDPPPPEAGITITQLTSSLCRSLVRRKEFLWPPSYRVNLVSEAFDRLSDNSNASHFHIMKFKYVD